MAIGPRTTKQLALLMDSVNEADPLALDAETLREIETRLASAGA